jgi:hypothetical protein
MTSGRIFVAVWRGVPDTWQQDACDDRVPDIG